MEQEKQQTAEQITSGERVIFFIQLVAKLILALAVLLFVSGFISYSKFNNISGVSLMMLAPFMLIACPLIHGAEIVIRAAIRYLQINGEPYDK